MGTCSATLAVGTCTVTNTLNANGSISVTKKLKGNLQSTQTFHFELSGPGGGTVDLADGGTYTWNNLSTATTYTLTETVPSGWAVKVNCSPESDVSGNNPATIDLSKQDNAHPSVDCTFTNELSEPVSASFTVSKDFSDDSESTVPVSLTCTDGSVSGTPTTMAEGSPASFTVSGFTSASGTTCTATETVPPGYTGDGTPAGTCSAKLSVGTCEIVNSLNSLNFTVSKVFSDHSTDSVPVAVACNSGTVSGSPTTMSEATAATVTVKGFSAAGTTTCTATETVPSGYTGSGTPAGTCSATLSAAGCTITNTLNTTSFVARKDFSDDSTAHVPVDVACGTATVSGSPTTMSEQTPATVTVSHYADAASTTCTATETVPSGYTADGDPPGSCSSSLDVGVCTITNTLNTASFNVGKVFSDGNDTSVPIEVSCTSGNVPGSPTSVSGGSTVTLTVEGFSDVASTTCTATETSVPSGYTAQNGGECSAPLGGGGNVVIEVVGCTIYNDLNTTTFEVSKQYSDDNTASVPVSLVCTGGTVAESSLDAAPGAPAQFTVTGFDDSDPGSCTATETTVPDGYTPQDGGTCTADLGGENGGGCTITNDLNTGSFTVAKVFSDHNEMTVAVSVACTTSGGTPVGGGNFNVSEGSPAHVDVSGFTSAADTTCTATETTVPDGYTADGDPPGTCSATLADEGCTITNTLNTATFTVAKDFTDNSTATVTMHLTCTSGHVVQASRDATEGSPAEFTVEGYSNDIGVSCDATEDAIPGYTGSDGGSCSSTLLGEGGGGCTITNTPDIVPPPTATFTVLKSFSDNNLAAVTVRVSCTAPAVVNPGAATMAQGLPAEFGVSGFDTPGSTTCTAIEVPISGYTGSGTPAGSCSASLAVGACTVTNTANTATFTVSKTFSDGNPASVGVNVACTSGTVSGGSTTMSQGSPATVTVRRFANAATTTCTASESPVAGYTGSGSPAGTCAAALSAGGCSITNTLVPPPPPPPLPPPGGAPPPGPVVTPVVVPPPPTVTVGGIAAVRGTTSSLRRVLVAGEVVRVSGRAPAGCDPVLRVDDRLIGPVDVARDGSFDVPVDTNHLDPGRHVAVVSCTKPNAPLVTKIFWIAAPLSSSNILLVALSSMTMLFGLGWVGIQTLAGTGLGGTSGAASTSARGKP
ncbi:MAG TPA: hypothetical protein VIH82_15035 [Acidimicrobiia bacterium]